MIDGENVHASNTDMYPSYHLWMTMITYNTALLEQQRQAEHHESNLLLHLKFLYKKYIDFSDFSRQKVKVFEKEMGIDREKKILRKVVKSNKERGKSFPLGK